MAPVAQSVGRGVLQVKGGARQGLLASVTDFEVGHHTWFWWEIGRPRGIERILPQANCRNQESEVGQLQSIVLCDQLNS